MHAPVPRTYARAGGPQRMCTDRRAGAPAGRRPSPQRPEAARLWPALRWAEHTGLGRRTPAARGRKLAAAALRAHARARTRQGRTGPPFLARLRRGPSCPAAPRARTRALMAARVFSPQHGRARARRAAAASVYRTATARWGQGRAGLQAGSHTCLVTRPAAPGDAVQLLLVGARTVPPYV